MRLRAAAVCLMGLLATMASAADDRSAGVGGTVSALNIDSDTSLSFSGSFEFRFNRVVGLDVDATMAPTLKGPFPTGPVNILSSATASTAAVQGSLSSFLIYPSPTYTNPGGRAVIVSNNVRVSIPTTVRSLEPYFVAGGGMATVRHTADLVYNPIVLASPLPAGVIAPTLPVRTFTQHVTSSSIDVALTLGGGVGIRTMSQLWIEADLRLIRLLGNEDRNVGRFGVGARYRF